MLVGLNAVQSVLVICWLDIFIQDTSEVDHIYGCFKMSG